MSVSIHRAGVTVFTCGSARSRPRAVQLSTAVLQQQVVLGLGDERLAGLVLLHHILRLDHVVEVVGADERQADMLEDLRGTNERREIRSTQTAHLSHCHSASLYSHILDLYQEGKIQEAQLV